VFYNATTGLDKSNWTSPTGQVQLDNSNWTSPTGQVQLNKSN